MSDFVDLHSHYLPGIDDGVDTFEEGLELCRRLRALGFGTVMATPHIRTAMFDNRRPELEAAHEAFCARAAGTDGLPDLGLGAEHFFDDVFWVLFRRAEALPYPGAKAMLVELPRERLPLRLERAFFQMRLEGIRPVLAHPERYRPFFKRSDELDRLIDVGALPLLDLMSLTGKYGRAPRRAAERMLDEGLYYAACSDAHRPADVPVVREALAALRRRIGDSEAEELLAANPRRILAGDADFE